MPVPGAHSPRVPALPRGIHLQRSGSAVTLTPERWPHPRTAPRSRSSNELRKIHRAVSRHRGEQLGIGADGRRHQLHRHPRRRHPVSPPSRHLERRRPCRPAGRRTAQGDAGAHQQCRRVGHLGADRPDPARSGRQVGRAAVPPVVHRAGFSTGAVPGPRGQRGGAPLFPPSRRLARCAVHGGAHAGHLGRQDHAVDHVWPGHAVEPGHQRHRLRCQSRHRRHRRGAGGTEHPWRFVRLAVDRRRQAVRGGRRHQCRRRLRQGRVCRPENHPHPRRQRRADRHGQCRTDQADRAQFQAHEHAPRAVFADGRSRHPAGPGAPVAAAPARHHRSEDRRAGGPRAP